MIGEKYNEEGKMTVSMQVLNEIDIRRLAKLKTHRSPQACAKILE